MTATGQWLTNSVRSLAAAAESERPDKVPRAELGKRVRLVDLNLQHDHVTVAQALLSESSLTESRNGHRNTAADIRAEVN
jgi:hypothetical protein